MAAVRARVATTQPMAACPQAGHQFAHRSKSHQMLCMLRLAGLWAWTAARWRR